MEKTPLLLPAAAVMAGIVLSDYFDCWPLGLVVLGVMLLAAFLLGRFRWWQTTLIVCCCLLVGALLGSLAKRNSVVAWPDHRMAVEAVVIAEPVVKARTITIDVLTVQGGHKVRCHVVCDARSQHVTIGQGLLLNININNVRAYRDSHFDYQRYMASHGFVGEAYVRATDWQLRQVSLRTLSLLQRIRLRMLCLRHQLLLRYRQWELDSGAYGVVAAMTLGDKSALDSELKDTYSRVGASHVLALSGLHLMIIYSVVSLVVGWRRFRLLSQVLTVLAIWGFALLAGLSPSVERAAMMVTTYALLSLGHRERMSVNTLAFVAIVMLIANPYALYDVGFQLSFAAVLAILTICPIFMSVIPLHVQQRHRWLMSVWALSAVSVSAQLGTAPLVAYYFGRFATWFLLANYIVVPLASVILYLSLACLLTSWWLPLQQLLVAGLSVVVVLMNRVLSYVAQWPASSIEGISLSALQVVLLYVAIAGVVLAVSVYQRAAVRAGQGVHQNGSS